MQAFCLQSTSCSTSVFLRLSRTHLKLQLDFSYNKDLFCFFLLAVGLFSLSFLSLFLPARAKGIRKRDRRERKEGRWQRCDCCVRLEKEREETTAPSDRHSFPILLFSPSKEVRGTRRHRRLGWTSMASGPNLMSPAVCLSCICPLSFRARIGSKGKVGHDQWAINPETGK